VLTNLVGNAVKYSPGGGRVHVEAGVCQGNAGSVWVRVVDEGLGFPPEVAERLFEAFYRVERREHRDIRGTGLGLAIVRRLVERMGGRVWAESDGPGRGARFTFTLPLAPATRLTERPCREPTKSPDDRERSLV
jgi:signal transduction histidine kinase